MRVVPRTHDNGAAGYSDYEPVDGKTSVFLNEIKRGQFDESKAVSLALDPNQASLHDAG
jgi:hypothetical protein